MLANGFMLRAVLPSRQLNQTKHFSIRPVSKFWQGTFESASRYQPERNTVLPFLALKDLASGLGISAAIFSTSTIFTHENNKKNQLFNNFDKLFPRLDIMQGSGYYGYRSASDDKMSKAFNSIIAANIGIFCCWNLGIAIPLLEKYFMLTQNSAWISFICCIFSHLDLGHLFFNMYCLNSFKPLIDSIMQAEEFIAVYLMGGVMASLASRFTKQVKGVNAPSVGASGAIMAILGLICSKYPDAKFTVPFIGPALGISVNGSTTVNALMFFEAAMLVLGVGSFDNAGHLGGLLFGIFYGSREGQAFFKKCQKIILKYWKFLNY